MLKRAVFCLLLILCSFLPAFADNTHSGGEQGKEMQAWFGDALASYIVSGCIPGTSGSTTTAAFACTGYVESSGVMTYVNQASKAVGPLNAGDGSYWIAIHKDVSSSVGGWTRQAGSHYLWQTSGARPADPSGGLVVALVNVVGGVVANVTPARSTAPVPPSSNINGKGWNELGIVCDGTTDTTRTLQAALTAGGTIYLPAGNCLVSDVFGRGYALKMDTQNTVLVGAGSVSTSIYVASATAGIYVTAINQRIQNLMVRGCNPASCTKVGTTGLTLNGGAYLAVQGSSFSDWTVDGILCSSGNNNSVRVRDSQMLRNNGYGVATRTYQTDCNAQIYESNIVQANGLSGFLVKGFNNLIVGGDTSSNGDYGVVMGEAGDCCFSTDNRVIEVYTESNGLGGYYGSSKAVKNLYRRGSNIQAGVFDAANEDMSDRISNTSGGYLEVTRGSVQVPNGNVTADRLVATGTNGTLAVGNIGANAMKGFANGSSVIGLTTTNAGGISTGTSSTTSGVPQEATCLMGVPGAGTNRIISTCYLTNTTGSITYFFYNPTGSNITWTPGTVFFYLFW